MLIICNGIIRGPSNYIVRSHRDFGGTWGSHEILETTDESEANVTRKGIGDYRVCIE